MIREIFNLKQCKNLEKIDIDQLNYCQEIIRKIFIYDIIISTVIFVIFLIVLYISFKLSGK